MGNVQSPQFSEDVGLLQAILGDGRPLLGFTGIALLMSGLFAIFQSATGHFLPHDEAWLGMSAEELCAVNGCRIVHFMIHDRVAFGGVVTVIGAIYLWLVCFPLRRREAWAWWTLLLSGVEGFGSFLLYLGHGYLDTWHGTATLALLPCFVLGLWRSRPAAPNANWRDLLRPAEPIDWRTRVGIGRMLLYATGIGLTCAGLTIMTVGATAVFVPQDLEFLQMTPAEITAVSERLIPLIAHDRAGFGGGVCCCGLLIFSLAWWGRRTRNWWQILFLAGAVGFGCAIGVHPAIGYNDLLHLLPAYLGAAAMAIALILLVWPNAAPRVRTDSHPYVVRSV
jgi:hypothetical protein